MLTTIISFLTQKWGQWLIGGVLLSATVAYGIHYERQIGYTTAKNEYTIKLDTLTKQYTQNILAAQQEAHKKEQELTKKVQDAQNEATERNKQIAIFAGRLDSTTKRLHDTIIANNAKLAAVTRNAAIKYAETLGDVLGECSKAYSDMATTADHQQSDIELLQKSWPK